MEAALVLSLMLVIAAVAVVRRRHPVPRPATVSARPRGRTPGSTAVCCQVSARTALDQLPIGARCHSLYAELLTMTLADAAKADRLVGLERDEHPRLPPCDHIEGAVQRWRRELGR